MLMLMLTLALMLGVGIPFMFNIVPILPVWIIDQFCPIEKSKGYGIKTLHVNQT